MNLLVVTSIFALQHFGIFDEERWYIFGGVQIGNFAVEQIDTFDGEPTDNFVLVPDDIVVLEPVDSLGCTFVLAHYYKIALELFDNAALVQIDKSSAEPAYIDS